MLTKARVRFSQPVRVVTQSYISMDKLVSYVRESFGEIVYKVTWPTFEELRKSTVLVLVASVVFAGVVFGMDKLLEQVLGSVYSF